MNGIKLAETREPVRVLHLHGDLVAGGGQTLSREWLRVSDRTCIDPHVVVLAEPVTLQDSFAKAGVSVTRIFGPRLVQVFHLIRYIRSHDIDVIHTQSEPDRKVGHWAALLTGRPVIAHLHSEWVYFAEPSPSNSLIGKLRSHVAFWFRKISEKSVVQFVATSHSVEQAFSQHTHKPIITVEPGVSLSVPTLEQREKYRDALGLEDDEIAIVSLSRLDEGKNLKDFILTVEMLAQTYKVRGFIAGQGPFRDDLQRLIQTRGLYREVQLMLPLDNPIELLGGADIFLAPSKQESFGISVLEALSAGVPVVGYDLDVYDRYEESCRTVPIGDVHGLVAECSYFIENPEEHVLAQKKATEISCKYNISDGAQTLMNLDEQYRKSKN